MIAQDRHVTVRKIDLCPNCGSGTLKHWCKSYDRLYLTSTQEFEYSKCRDCGVLFLSTLPLPSDVQHFYPANYGPYLGTDYSKDGNITTARKPKSLILARRSLLLMSRFLNPIMKIFEDVALKKRLDSFYSGGPKIFLDFGCGSEHFLNSMRQNGWSTTGMDFSPQAIRSVLENGHHGILYENEDVWQTLTQRQFEVVRMNHVIEHLYNPRVVLKHLYDSMSTGGEIHIATPNSASLSSHFFKKFWLGLDCPRHIMIYTPRIIRTLLKQVGFKNVEVYHETLTKDLARSIGFYEHERGWIKHQDISNKISDKGLRQILFGPAVFNVLIRRSDRIHVFASK